MSSYHAGGDYDERLLASVPAASRAERQEGYNVNLLDGDHTASPVLGKPGTTLGHGNGDFEIVPPSKEAIPYHSSKSAVPWYRQGKWRIGMLIGAIIIIGAVVGGAVGGTVGKHNNAAAAAHSGPSTAFLSTSSLPWVAPPGLGSSSSTPSSTGVGAGSNPGRSGSLVGPTTVPSSQPSVAAGSLSVGQ